MIRTMIRLTATLALLSLFIAANIGAAYLWYIAGKESQLVGMIFVVIAIAAILGDLCLAFAALEMVFPHSQGSPRKTTPKQARGGR